MTGAISQYRELLTSEESLSSLDRAIKLAMRITSGEGSGNGKRWHKLQDGQPPQSKGRGTARTRILKQVTSALSTVPPKVSQSLDQFAEDQYSLLIDTLLLVFHQAYFVLLPGSPNGRDSLLAAFMEFSAFLPRPQDRFQVLGLVEVERNQFDAAAESFRTALAATHSDAHDFVTRVQMVWTVLMERRLYSQAFDCLMDVYPRTSREDLGEISALLRQTFLESRRHQAPRTSAGPARKQA
jgi:hypothetical protein